VNRCLYESFHEMQILDLDMECLKVDAPEDGAPEDGAPVRGIV
jgi:hypothetical protein